MIIVKCQKCDFENNLFVEDLTKSKCRKCEEPLDFKKDGIVKYPESSNKEGSYYYIESNDLVKTP